MTRTGKVSEQGWPLVSVRVVNPATGAALDIDAAIDTGCSNGLVLLWDQVFAFGLKKAETTRATLADRRTVMFACYLTEVEWFGDLRTVRTFGSAGPHALVGLGLLEDLILTIDYPARTVSLLPSSSAPAAN